MQLRKLIARHIRLSGSGVDLAADVKAAIAGNVGERGQTTTVSSHSEAVATGEERRNGEEEDRAPGR